MSDAANSNRRTPRLSSGASSLPPDIAEELKRTARPADRDKALRALERAADLLSEGAAGEAAKEAEKAKRMAPRSSAVREILGLSYYRQGRFRDALREMQAYRRMSGRADQNHIIADCHRALGHAEKAIPLAEEALSAPISDEAKAEAVVVAASALADRERYAEALGILRRFPTRPDVGRPYDLRVWYVAGRILARAGRRAEAAREFRRVLRHDQSAFDTAEQLAQLG